MADNLKQEQAVRLLKQMADELGRVPRRADLSEEQLSFIKCAFGPLPRALEAAALKPPSPLHKEKQKRRKQKRRGAAALKSKSKGL